MNEKIERLINNVEKSILGKRDVIEKVVVALLSGGHILIEDVPGVGKTQLVYALAKSVAGRFNRIQLTPDVMPSDIVGFSMINQTTKNLEYKTGVSYCNFLLADEINRASPKVQSSLLEIMEEGQISLDGNTYMLPRPFMTFATQNPVESFGTYHLPEAQMDRFIMRISIGYPDHGSEVGMLANAENSLSKAEIEQVLNIEDVLLLQSQALTVNLVPAVKSYIVNLVSATRNSDYIRLGASPRGSLALMRTSKAYAFINGRGYVTPDDIAALAVSVLSHRIILSQKGKVQFASQAEAIQYILQSVEVPVR